MQFSSPDFASVRLNMTLNATQTINVTSTAAKVPFSNATIFGTTTAGTPAVIVDPSTNILTLPAGRKWQVRVKVQGVNFSAAAAELTCRVNVNGTLLSASTNASSIGIGTVGALVKGSQSWINVIVDTTRAGFNAATPLFLEVLTGTGTTCDITTASGFYLEIIQ